MPVSVDIKVNKGIIHRLHIGRVRGTSVNPDSVNTYSVLAQLDTPTPAQWDEGVFITHRYGDGVVVLTQIALTALQDKGLV